MKVAERRLIEARFPIEGAGLTRIAAELEDAEKAGFALTDASTIEGGSQRDPYAVGLRLVLTRDST